MSLLRAMDQKLGVFQQRIIVVKGNDSAEFQLIDQFDFLRVRAVRDSMDFRSSLAPAQNNHGIDKHWDQR